MAVCECHIVAQFPGVRDQGIISATLKANTAILITSDGLYFEGPTIGQLSITGYDVHNYSNYSCPGRAGTSFSWIRKFDCYNNLMYFIPKAGDKAYVEGEVSNQIHLTTINSYKTFSASAGSGPASIYLWDTHKDGFDFEYTGGPISIDKDRNANTSFLNEILPSNSELFISSFSWQQTPPNIAIASYSFTFSYGG